MDASFTNNLSASRGTDFFGKPDGSDGKVRSRNLTAVSASFVYEWGYSLAEPCRAKFAIEPQSGGHRSWILISREDGHGTTAFAISVHMALIKDTRFADPLRSLALPRKSGAVVEM